jgi:PBSX family phage terminase large subunit
MKLTPVQRTSFVRADARINIWHGPVRSGKTVASMLRWLDYINRDAPPGELYMFGKTVHALKRNIISPMMDYVGPDMRYSSGEGLIKLWGRQIHVIGANDERAENKVRGSTSAGSYADEVALYPEDFFRMATSRMSVQGAKMFATTNPDSPTHWLKTNYINRCGEINCKSFTWGLRKNTFLDVEYVDAIEKEYTGLWRKRFIEGKWVLAEGAIHDMFDEKRHVNLGPPFTPDYYIVGVDYGTGNPTAFVMIAVHHRHNDRPLAWMEREYYYDSKKANRQKTDTEYAIELKHFLERREFKRKIVSHCYVDPSAASFKRECEKHGIGCIVDADNDVLNGIRTQSTMLHQDRYTIHATCTQTIDDYGAYVWDPKKAKRGEDAPMKSNDHTKDAERYALHTHFGQDSILYTSAGLKG